MRDELRTLLWQENPWIGAPESLERWLGAHHPKVFVPRQVLQQNTRRWSQSDRAHLVIGPRQAGKSTVIWEFLARRGELVLYLDCERPLIRQWCQEPPLFLADLKQLVDMPVGLFLEEAQHLDEAGLFVKGLVDRKIGAPIWVTGSSSYHLGARTRESLAGRATRTRLLPFSLAEVCQDLGGRPPATVEHLCRERFERHLRWGGYPAVWLSDEPEAQLTDLVEAVVIRDASDLFRIARPDAFRRLLRLTAGQVGSRVNHSEWASILGISRDTVGSYLEILAESHLILELPPFAAGKRVEITARPKVFWLDAGLRNRLVHDFRPLAERVDAGAALENWIAGELWKALPEGATLHFWSSSGGAEVDFVVVRGEQIVAVEVKAAKLGRAQIPRSLRSFIDAYQPRVALLANTGFEHSEPLGATNIEWVLPQRVAARVVEVFSAGVGATGGRPTVVTPQRWPHNGPL